MTPEDLAFWEKVFLWALQAGHYIPAEPYNLTTAALMADAALECRSAASVVRESRSRLVAKALGLD